MGTDTGHQFPAVIRELLESAPRFEFFQALRLLERLWEGGGAVGGKLDERLRLRPAPEISFPAADIRRLRLQENGRLEMELNFMGLYGVDAPLPTYIPGWVARDDESSALLRAFLDIFSHRLYALFYLAWKKYRPQIQLEEEEPHYLAYLAALSGQSIDEDEGEELGFSGPMGARVRSASALGGMLSEYLGQVPVRVEQFVPRWVRLDQRARLGSEGEDAMALGDNTILGDAVLDVSGRVNIHIGPVNTVLAGSLMPGRPRARELARLVERYLDPTLAFDVVLEVAPEADAAPPLGGDLVLGWTTWLGGASDGHYLLRISGASYFAGEGDRPEAEEQREPLPMVA